jgi:hypothetical protein
LPWNHEQRIRFWTTFYGSGLVLSFLQAHWC